MGAFALRLAAARAIRRSSPARRHPTITAKPTLPGELQLTLPSARLNGAAGAVA